jgi:hypothetical protein|tara:strand:- start:351 stop:677 length:327 start_codon:yes stop_codon:yes gene_type:complete
MPDWLEALLGIKGNRRATNAVKAATNIRKATPYGMLTSAALYGIDKVSDRVKEVDNEVDSFDAYWENRLGHAGPPKLDDFTGDYAEQDYEDTLELYHSMQPLDANWFR